jgi:hypothetical protein
MAHSQHDVHRVLLLVADGYSDYEIARRTRIPRSTVLRWRHGGTPGASRPGPLCARCGYTAHDRTKLPGAEYAYLLGQYLGDGTIYRVQRTHALRISSDAQYTGIISECCDAIEALKQKRPYVRYHPYKRLASIISYWKAWLCLFPQHGPGRKHHRTIALAAWQVEIVEAHPGRFLRGLIHSDGWRGLNRVRVKGRDYAYPLSILESLRRHPAALHLCLRAGRCRLAALGQVAHFRGAPGGRRDPRHFRRAEVVTNVSRSALARSTPPGTVR